MARKFFGVAVLLMLVLLPACAPTETPPATSASPNLLTPTVLPSSLRETYPTLTPAPATEIPRILPAGFSHVVVAEGFNQPTAFAFAGDRILVAELGGTVRVVEPDGTVQPEPYLTLKTWGKNKRGIFEIAVDPKYDENGYVYVYYTAGPGAKDYPGKPFDRLSRFTTRDGVGTDETILIDKIPSDGAYHNGGALVFGADDMLYVTTGVEDESRTAAQALDDVRGKILRINRDGSAPPDNPFYNTAGADKRIFALGFRNPFRMVERPSNGALIVGDVGEGAWEELDTLAAGADYGWARFEGPCPAETPDCDPTQTDFGKTTPPLHAYRHTGGGENGGAVMAGAFPSKSNYPPPFADALFYGDWGVGWVHALALDDKNQKTGQYDFDEVEAPVAFGTGPDGNVYVMSYTTGTLFKYVYAP